MPSSSLLVSLSAEFALGETSGWFWLSGEMVSFLSFFLFCVVWLFGSFGIVYFFLLFVCMYVFLCSCTCCVCVC